MGRLKTGQERMKEIETHRNGDNFGLHVGMLEIKTHLKTYMEIMNGVSDLSEEEQKKHIEVAEEILDKFTDADIATMMIELRKAKDKKSKE